MSCNRRRGSSIKLSPRTEQQPITVSNQQTTHPQQTTSIARHPIHNKSHTTQHNNHFKRKVTGVANAPAKVTCSNTSVDSIAASELLRAPSSTSLDLDKDRSSALYTIRRSVRISNHTFEISRLHPGQKENGLQHDNAILSDSLETHVTQVHRRHFSYGGRDILNDGCNDLDADSQFSIEYPDQTVANFYNDDFFNTQHSTEMNIVSNQQFAMHSSKDNNSVIVLNKSDLKDQYLGKIKSNTNFHKRHLSYGNISEYKNNNFKAYDESAAMSKKFMNLSTICLDFKNSKIKNINRDADIPFDNCSSRYLTQPRKMLARVGKRTKLLQNSDNNVKNNKSNEAFNNEGKGLLHDLCCDLNDRNKGLGKDGNKLSRTKCICQEIKTDLAGLGPSDCV